MINVLEATLLRVRRVACHRCGLRTSQVLIDENSRVVCTDCHNPLRPDAYEFIPPPSVA